MLQSKEKQRSILDYWQGSEYASDQPAITLSKLTIEILDQGVKYVQRQQ